MRYEDGVGGTGYRVRPNLAPRPNWHPVACLLEGCIHECREGLAWIHLPGIDTSTPVQGLDGAVIAPFRYFEAPRQPSKAYTPPLLFASVTKCGRL